RKCKGCRPGSGKYINLFQSLIKHAVDGEGFILHNKGTSTAPLLHLINRAGREGRQPLSIFDYQVFEAALLSRLREVNPDDLLKSPAETTDRVDVLRASLANVRRDIANIKEDLRGGYSKGLSALLREQEAAEEKLAAELQQEKLKALKPKRRAWQ